MGWKYNHILSAQVDKLPEPENEKEYRALLPVLVARDLDAGLTSREVGAKYDLTKDEVDYLNRRANVAQSLLIRAKKCNYKKDPSIGLKACTHKGCKHLVVTSIDDLSPFCPTHTTKRKYVAKACGEISAKHKWLLAAEIRRELLRQIIKLAIPKNQKVVASYFVDEIRDAGALQREHKLSSVDEAKAIIVDAGIVLKQAIRALNEYTAKAFRVPKNYWAMEIKDVVDGAKKSDIRVYKRKNKVSAQADKPEKG
jgi:hypothetical protein